jgi:hypothetical protein
MTTPDLAADLESSRVRATERLEQIPGDIRSLQAKIAALQAEATRLKEALGVPIPGRPKGVTEARIKLVLDLLEQGDPITSGSVMAAFRACPEDLGISTKTSTLPSITSRILSDMVDKGLIRRLRTGVYTRFSEP